jgi:hypothetical protein
MSEITPEVAVKQGDWVLFRTDSAYERVKVSIAQAAKVTPKLIRFEGAMYPRQCGRIAVVAAFPDEQSAREVRDAIGGVSGEFERRRRIAEDTRSQRITEALTAANKQIASIISARHALALSKGSDV